MLNNDGKSDELVLKLIDFGFSRKLEENLQANTFCGTRCYMAPEVTIGKGYTFTADVW